MSSPGYTRGPAQRFQFAGMNTVNPPDAQPAGKFPLAINARAYLQDSLTPRLPQSNNLLSGGALPALVHSLRRMDDTIAAPIVPTSTGPNACGTGTDISFPGVAWANPGNITVQDGNYASVTVTSGIPETPSDLLFASNFGFAIANTVSISGIMVSIKGLQSSLPAGATVAARIIKAGVVVGVTKTFTLPAANAFITLGSNVDLWGASWLYSDVNATNFGIQLQASPPFGAAGVSVTFDVDFVEITIYGFATSSVGAGFVYVSGAATSIYVNTTSVATGMSGNRLALVPFRPNASVEPWMYIGDSTKMVKVRRDGTAWNVGIAEPQLIPTTTATGSGPLTGTYQYAYQYRSSQIGAPSNSSPTSHSVTVAPSGQNVSVTCTASTDPQADLIDVYRFGGGLLNYTYVTTILNSAPQFIDNLSDVELANNPIMGLSNYQPFPSIDIPRTGTLTVTSAGAPAGTVNLTQVSGDVFNVRWLGGTIIFISQTGSTQTSTLILFNRPSSASAMIGQIQPVGSSLPNGTYSFTINQPILAAQPLPALWGPTDNAAYMFACGDPLRPGTLYFTAGNNPDAAPQTNSIEITSPAEPLIGGCIVGGLSLVMSAEHGWLIYPNFAQATATIVGVTGSPFSTVMSITDRGLVTKEGICTDGGGTAFFIAKDSIRASTGGVGSSSITDADLYNLFPHEGETQQPYVIGGITIQPPDYSQPNGMALRFSQGYLYFDYIGLDNGRYTLVYDASHSSVGAASDNFVSNSLWSADVYFETVSIHADNPGMAITPGYAPPIGCLMGCIDGSVRQLSSAAFEVTGVANLMTVLTPAFDGGEQRANKHFGDLYLETTSPTAAIFSLTLYSDRYSILQSGQLSPTAIPPAAGTRVASILELAAGLGIYARDIELAISTSVNNVGSAIHLWQPSFILQPETTGERVTDWDDMGVAGTKFIQGVIIEADTGNMPKDFEVQSADNLGLFPLAEVGTGIAWNGRGKKAFSFASPFAAHSVRLYPLDTIPWRVWSVQWVWVPYPELALDWGTELLSHGLEGYGHIGEMNVAHISTADITLTLTPDVGPVQVITIPNSGGAQVKVLVIPPAFKWKLLGYQFSSSAAFRLWKEDVEVKVGQWGREDKYQIVKPFGGESSPGTEV